MEVKKTAITITMLVFISILLASSCVFIFLNKKVYYINPSAIGVSDSHKINYETAARVFSEGFVLNLENISNMTLETAYDPFNKKSPIHKYIKYISPSLRNKMIFFLANTKRKLLKDNIVDMKFTITEDTKIKKYKNKFIVKVVGNETKKTAMKTITTKKAIYLMVIPSPVTYINKLGLELNDFLVKVEK